MKIITTILLILSIIYPFGLSAAPAGCGKKGEGGDQPTTTYQNTCEQNGLCWKTVVDSPRYCVASSVICDFCTGVNSEGERCKKPGTLERFYGNCFFVEDETEPNGGHYVCILYSIAPSLSIQVQIDWPCEEATLCEYCGGA